MDILNEIEDFKRLSGLLTEQGSVAIRRIGSIIDNLISPGARAADSELDRLAKKGIQNLTDDELFILLSKLPKKEVAKILVNNSIIFSARNAQIIKQNYLNKLTRGDMKWDEIVDEINRGKRTLWGQSPNIPDNIYDEISELIDEVNQIYIDDVIDFIRKNGSPDVVRMLPESIPQSINKILDRLPNWLKNSTAAVRPIFDRLTKDLNKINIEKDQLFKQIADKIKREGGSANINAEVRRLTELATAAKRNNDLTAKQILDRWLIESNVSGVDKSQFFKGDRWYSEWSNLIESQSKQSYIQSYLEAWSKLNPIQKVTKDGVTRWRVFTEYKDFFSRLFNLLFYASPYTRKDLTARMAAKGVAPVVARRLASHYLLYGVYWPMLVAVVRYLKAMISGDKVAYWELWWDTFKNSDANLLVLNPESWTLLDNAISLLITDADDAAEQLLEPIRVDFEKAEQLLSGEYEGDDTTSSKSMGVRSYIKNKYPEIPRNYLTRIFVSENNKVYFVQVTGGGRTNIPLALINGEVYLINKSKNKKIRFDKIFSLNEGLIKLIKEQNINWDSGEVLDDVEDTYDNITSSSWSEVLTGRGGDGESNNPLGPQTGIDFSVLPRRGQDDDLHLSTPRTGSDFTENKDYNGPLKSDLTDAVTQAKTVTGGLGDKLSKVIGILDTPEGEKIKLAGMLSDNSTPHYFDVTKNEQGEWGWYNDEENKWEPFKEY